MGGALSVCWIERSESRFVNHPSFAKEYRLIELQQSTSGRVRLNEIRSNRPKAACRNRLDAEKSYLACVDCEGWTLKLGATHIRGDVAVRTQYAVAHGRVAARIGQNKAAEALAHKLVRILNWSPRSRYCPGEGAVSSLALDSLAASAPRALPPVSVSIPTSVGIAVDDRLEGAGRVTALQALVEAIQEPAHLQ